MTYIESFKIEGLAGRSKIVERTLDRHVNIFWGLNGTGKTSLLKILNSALSNDIDILRRVPFVSAEVIFWSSEDEAKIRRTIVQETIDFNADEDDFEVGSTRLEPAGDGLWREVEVVQQRTRSWSTELVAGALPAPRTVRARPLGAIMNGRFAHSFMPISRLAQVQGQRNNYATRRGLVVDDAYLDQDFAEQVRVRWQTYNSQALSRIRAIQQQGLASILALLFGGASGSSWKGAAAPVTGDEAYMLVSNFLSEQGISLRFGQAGFLERYENQSDLRGVVASIQDVTDDVAEELRPQGEFQKVIERLYSGGKSLVLDPNMPPGRALRVEIDGVVIPLQSLSSGEKQLLRLMLEVLAADSSTVMIDEPELSMHVDWQELLVAAMRSVNPDCQLVLATHSPEVMADVSDRYVFEL